MEFINKNLVNVNPELFYQVSEHVTTFKIDQSFDHVTEFRNRNLLKAKSEAEKFYHERKSGFEGGAATFFLPFAAAKEFKMGENAAYSISMSLVVWYGEGNELNMDCPLLGYGIENESEHEQNLETESYFLENIG